MIRYETLNNLNKENTGDFMKNLMAALITIAASVSTFAYSDKVNDYLERKAFKCQLSGHGITDVTYAYLSFDRESWKSTGRHIADNVSLDIYVSYDRDYTTDGPKNITKLVSEISRIGQYAGTTVTHRAVIDGLPKPTVFRITEKNTQLEVKMKANFVRTGENTAKLKLTYQSIYLDVPKTLTFSGPCLVE